MRLYEEKVNTSQIKESKSSNEKHRDARSFSRTTTPKQRQKNIGVQKLEAELSVHMKNGARNVS